MKLFDPHIHMNARTTDEYEAMAAEGVMAVCEPAFWVGQPRTHVGTYEDYLKTIIGWERFRASQFGIHHFCTIGLNPREANRSEIAAGVIECLPRYLYKEGVLGIGEIGFDDMTPDEEKYFLIQLEMAKQHRMPVIIHTPHRNKKKGAERTIALLQDVGIPQETVTIDHNTEETLPLVLGKSGCWAGHTLYPRTKMSKERMIRLVEQYGTERIIINSSADWGISDPLNIPKLCRLMRERGFAAEMLHKLFWQNPIAFFSHGANFDAAQIEQRPEIDQTRKWEDNTVLRGQQPIGGSSER